MKAEMILTTTAAAQEITPALANSFIAFIDRAERTTQTYLTNIKQFFAWLRFKAITRPDRNDVILYRQWLLSEHEAIQFDPGSPDGWKFRIDRSGNKVLITCKPNTVTGYLRAIAQFFKWTAVNGFYPNISENVHAPKVKSAAHKKDALTVSEVAAIEGSIIARAAQGAQEAQEATKDKAGRLQRSTEQGKRLLAMYLLAVNAGLRTVEISRACVKDFAVKGGEAWLYVWGKGHTEADTRKALAPAVAVAINDYLKSRTDNVTGASPLFCSTGNRSHGKRIAPTTISVMLKEAMKEAGYNSERLTAHSLRHTAGTAVQEISGDLFATQRYMRHADPKTTEIYLHNDTGKQDASLAKRLFDYFHSNGTEQPNLSRLDQAAARLTPEQVLQLTKLAEAMA